jgi:hypothetical protein
MKVKHTMLAVAFAAMAGFAAPAMAVHGTTFEVTMMSSLGTPSTDCFRFDDAGNLTIDGLQGQVLTFAHTNLGTNDLGWQATSRGADTFGIALHGQVTLFDRFTRAPLMIIGEGIDETGVTYVFNGVANPDCQVAPPNGTPTEGGGNLPVR